MDFIGYILCIKSVYNLYKNCLNPVYKMYQKMHMKGILVTIVVYMIGRVGWVLTPMY